MYNEPAKMRTFREIMALAIEREKDAAAGYQALRAMVRDRGAKAFLAELRDEEKTHQKLLQDLARGRHAAVASEKVPDLGISDFLIEEPPGADMSYQDILIFAARKEHREKRMRFDIVSILPVEGSGTSCRRPGRTPRSADSAVLRAEPRPAPACREQPCRRGQRECDESE